MFVFIDIFFKFFIVKQQKQKKFMSFFQTHLSTIYSWKLVFISFLEKNFFIHHCNLLASHTWILFRDLETFAFYEGFVCWIKSSFVQKYINILAKISFSYSKKNSLNKKFLVKYRCNLKHLTNQKIFSK